MDLNTIWFLLVGVLIAGYAILDGFDLGAGVLHLFTRDERERRVMMNAIGPVWDGNEVWLLTGGGALFAAFPPVYASVFSGFYLAFMLLLVALIFRAVSFEFRSKVTAAGWRRGWDVAFGVGSALPALLFGVAVGNVLRGLDMDASGVTTTLPGLLNPFALLIGLLGLAMFVLHGASYLGLKTEGALQERMRRVASASWVALIALYAVSTAAAYAVAPYLFEHWFSSLADLAVLRPAAGELHHGPGRDPRHAVRARFRRLGRRDAQHHRARGGGHVPAPGAVPARPGQQPDDLQRGLHAADTHGDAGDRAGRDALRDPVHGADLPGVQGEDGHHVGELLGSGRQRSGQLPDAKSAVVTRSEP